MTWAGVPVPDVCQTQLLNFEKQPCSNATVQHLPSRGLLKIGRVRTPPHLFKNQMGLVLDCWGTCSRPAASQLKRSPRSIGHGSAEFGRRAAEHGVPKLICRIWKLDSANSRCSALTSPLESAFRFVDHQSESSCKRTVSSFCVAGHSNGKHRHKKKA